MQTAQINALLSSIAANCGSWLPFQDETTEEITTLTTETKTTPRLPSFDFSTSDYQFAHGKHPRGRGNWAFSLMRNGGDLFWFNGSYADAKIAARKHFAEDTRRRIYLQS